MHIFDEDSQTVAFNSAALFFNLRFFVEADSLGGKHLVWMSIMELCVEDFMFLLVMYTFGLLFPPCGPSGILSRFAERHAKWQGAILRY